MLIPEVAYAKFIKLSSRKIARMKSCVVTSDGEPLFYAIIPSKDGGTAIFDDISTHAEYLGNRSNTVSGETLEEIEGVANIPVQV